MRVSILICILDICCDGVDVENDTVVKRTWKNFLHFSFGKAA